MSHAAATDLEVLRRHRQIWDVRPDLRSVYREWFDWLLHGTAGCVPVVEIGCGPGFFKDYFPGAISTDVVASPWADAVCDAQRLPFQTGSVGALVMVDVLHHLSRPLDFMVEAHRVLREGGRLVTIEPWITPLSFVIYRCFHHEECRFGVDLASPFEPGAKRALDGNATIPFLLVKNARSGKIPLRLIEARAFLALPYLATLGFKRSSQVSGSLLRLASMCERLLEPVRSFAATRTFLVWEKAS